MAEFATLVDDVRGKIQLDESIYPIGEVRRQVELAHHLYFGSVPIESLTEQESVLIITRSWADICRIMATRFALHFPIRTQNGETDESKVVDNYLKIADRLDREIGELEEELGINQDYIVKNSKMIKRDTYFGRLHSANSSVVAPNNAVAPVTGVVATSNVAGSVSISWSPSESPNFDSYQVWASQTPDIFNPAYLSKSSNPGIADGSISLYTTHINHRTGAVVRVTPSGMWYFIVLLRTNLGAVAASSEIGVNVL
jgi:hypothetical protein